jgi:hypothetical protein
LDVLGSVSGGSRNRAASNQREREDSFDRKKVGIITIAYRHSICVSKVTIPSKVRQDHPGTVQVRFSDCMKRDLPYEVLPQHINRLGIMGKSMT